MTLVNNHNLIGQKRTLSGKKSDHLQRLKTGLKTDDLSLVTYSGFCDSEGGFCACGHEIKNRYHTSHGIVGSECVQNFTQTVQKQIRASEKMLKKEVAELRKAEKEKADVLVLLPKATEALQRLLDICPDYQQGYYKNLYAGNFRNPTAKGLKKTIVTIKHRIKEEERTR